MSEEQGRESGRGGGLIWILLVAVPLLYVLSIGPVGALAKRNPNFPLPLGVIYYPVVWLHDNTPLQKPLEAYARLWGWQ